MSKNKDIRILIEAIKHNDIEQIKDLVKNQGYDINAKDEDRNPLVFQLLYRSDQIYYNTFKILDKLGANFDVKNVRGTTFLSKVIEYGNLDVVRLVLTKSIEQLNMINNSDGKYPLFIAVTKCNEDMVRLLAEEFKADLNIKSKNGNPLIFSVLDFYNFNYEMAMLLIKLDTKLNVKNSMGDTPLKLAVQAQKYDVVEAMLEKGASSNTKDRKDKYILHFAYDTRDENLMRLLVEYGADINCKNKEGDTLLASAVGGIGSYYHNNYEYKMVNLLLELGASPNLKNKEGESIIFKIIEHGKSETLDIFLEHNGKINVTNRDKKSPAQVAIDKEMPNILESLFKYGTSCTGLTSNNPEIKIILDQYMNLGGDTDTPQDNT